MTTTDKQTITNIQNVINKGKVSDTSYQFTEDSAKDFRHVVKLAFRKAFVKFMEKAEQDVKDRYDLIIDGSLVSDGIAFDVKTPHSQNDISIHIQLVQNTPRPLLIKHGASQNRLSRAEGFVDLMQQIADKNVEEQKSKIYSSLVREAQLASSLAKLSQRNGLIVIGKSDGLQRVALTVPEQLDAFQNDTQYDLYDIIENPTDKMVDEALQFGTIFQG